MDFLIRSIFEGGWTVYLILGCGLLHAVPVIAQLALVKKADLTPYLWGGLAGILLIALMGSLLGIVQSFGALEQAQPEQRAALMARGVAILLANSMWASIIVLPGVLLTGVATCLTRNLTPVRLKD